MNQKLAEGVNLSYRKHNTICTKCIQNKLSNIPYPKEASNKSEEVLSLIHSDVCGPKKTETFTGKRYIITFIDHYRRFSMNFLPSHKGQAIAKLKEFVPLTKQKFANKLKRSGQTTREYLDENF